MESRADIMEHDMVGVVCAAHDNRADELLEILHAVQRKAGYLSDDALREIAHALNISRAEIHGVVTFYHDFRREPPAKLTIKICRAEACQAVGAEDLIRAAEAEFGTKLGEPAKNVALEAAYCLGNCALGPATMIKDQLYGRVSAKKLQDVVQTYTKKSAS